MNGKKAKQLRKEIYGDQSIRQRRKYNKKNDGTKMVIGTVIRLFTLVNDPNSLRAKYQRAKRASA